MPVRALLRAISVNGTNSPYDTLTMKVFYPAEMALDETSRETGVLPVARDQAPYPIVIFFGGVNCESYQYYWLAQAIAEEGYIVAVPSWMAQQLAGRTSFTPGIDLAALKPEVYGSRPSLLSLLPILEALNTLNGEGVLANAIDLGAVILGGHSAGGTMALMNADRRFMSGIVGSFSLMANVLATSALGGWERGQIPPLPTDVPALLIGGDADQINVHHNAQFGRETLDSGGMIAAMLSEGYATPHPKSSAIVIQGATHYSVCYPLDETIGRTFLEEQPEKTTAIRAMVKDAVVWFLGEFIKTAPIPHPLPTT